MKRIDAILLFIVLSLCGCSDKAEEAVVTIEADGQPARTIRIVVEEGDDVIVEDPYIEEIEAISAAYMKARTRFLNERQSMTPEEREAFGQLQSASGERIRELQALRKQYIIAQMKKHHGVRFVAKAGEQAKAGQSTRDYFQRLQESQPSEE